MPSWLQGVLSSCPLATKFKGERLPIPNELRQLPYFQKRFRSKYAHLYKAHDERGLKCPMDVRTMEDIVSFCQHVLRSDDIIGPTKDQARIFLARVLNVYNAQNPVPGAMDEDIFDSAGNLKQKQPEAADNSSRNANHSETMTEKPALPELRPEQAEELEAAAARLSSEQDRRRMRRLERHIVKLEARLTLLEPDSDEASSNSPVHGAAPKRSLDVSRERDREREREKDRDLRDVGKGLGLGLGMGDGGLARTGSGAGTGAAGGTGIHTRTASGGVSGGVSNPVRVASSGGNGGHARTTSGANSPLARAGSGAGSNNSGATARSNSGKDKDTSLRERDGESRDNKDVLKGDKELREAKVLLREVPVIKRLPRSTPPQLRTPPPPPVRT